MKQIRYIGEESGFTLIEAIVAMLVLVIGVFSLYSMQISSIGGNSVANDLTRASTWASDRIELLINTPYDDLIDKDNDGTNQDPDWNGIDELGIDTDFGLGDATPATADDFVTSPDNRYTIFWNVAEDHPMADLKTLRINVLYFNNNQQKVVSMNFIKPKM